MHLSSLQLACVALATLALATAAPPASPPHHVARRSFFNLQCRGVYDAAIFARLDRICDDCYTLFRESELYNLCRRDCFTTVFFPSCMSALQMDEEEMKEAHQFIDYLGRR